MLVVVAALNISRIAYYQSEDYSDFKFEGNWLTNSSAICTRDLFVPCLDCDQENFGRTALQKRRIKLARHENDNTQINFALKNNCSFMGFDLGISFLFDTILLSMLSFVVINSRVRKNEKQFDEITQSAQVRFARFP